MHTALIALFLTPAMAGHPADSHNESDHTAGESGDPSESGAWITRVGGEPEAELETRAGEEGPLYSAGRVSTETKLPVGYPAPTAPGAIEVKHYPSMRRAQFTSNRGRGLQGGDGFWPLFQHIQRNDIAMTSPVEMETADTNADGSIDQWTMAFLYHTPDLGPTGDDGSVEIIDTEPMTYLAMGVRGRRTPNTLEGIAADLDAWIGESAEWERAGEVRLLGYNGPYIPPANQWWEVQIPVQRVTAETASAD